MSSKICFTYLDRSNTCFGDTALGKRHQFLMNIHNNTFHLALIHVSTQITANNGVSNACTFHFILHILNAFLSYIHSAILFLTYTYTWIIAIWKNLMEVRYEISWCLFPYIGLYALYLNTVRTYGFTRPVWFRSHWGP